MPQAASLPHIEPNDIVTEAPDLVDWRRHRGPTHVDAKEAVDSQRPPESY
jgi:hypothetical protein